VGDGRRPRSDIACGLFSALVGIGFGYYPARKPPISIQSKLAVRIAVRVHGNSSNTAVQPQRRPRRVGWRLRDFHQRIASAGVDSLRERGDNRIHAHASAEPCRNTDHDRNRGHGRYVCVPAAGVSALSSQPHSIQSQKPTRQGKAEPRPEQTHSDMAPGADRHDQITIFQIVRGLMALNGPTYRSGTNGSTTSAAAAKIRASVSSPR